MGTNLEDVDAAVLAEKYVWKIHGRGLSTSVGVQTRRLLSEAFLAWYLAAKEENDAD